MELPILYFKGSQAEISILWCISVRKICLISLQLVQTWQPFHCLPKNLFAGSVKPVLSGHSKKDKTKAFKTYCSIMKVDESILQYFWPAWSDNRFWKPIFGLFLEWPLKTGFTVSRMKSWVKLLFSMVLYHWNNLLRNACLYLYNVGSAVAQW